MELIERVNVKPPVQGDVQAAALCNKDEAVLLISTGEVLLYNLKSMELEMLIETNPAKGIHYADGGFAPCAPSSIYTMDDIIVVVNDYKKHGFVLNRKEGYRIHLCREDYHADISKYPIALFYSEAAEPHLIYGTAWNQVQIANLKTRQVLTADKALIEENAEQRHLDFYQTQQEHNKFFWPNSYDYFYGELLISPDKKKFASVGWAWGSFDCCKLYDIKAFISNHRIRDTTIGYWEHNNRAICFVNSDTLAVLAHPFWDEEEGAKKDSPYELRLYAADGQGEKERLILNGSLDLSGAKLFYHEDKRQFITFSEGMGTTLFSMSGEVLYHNASLIPQEYSIIHDCFILHDKQTLRICQIG